MAAVVGPSEITYAWLGPVLRVEKDAKDPSIRYVWGKATDGTVDSDEQIVDPAFAKKALADWYETGANVRQMHATTLPPAGKGVLLESKNGQGADDGEWVRTKVVEPVAVKLVDEGVYTGYSVGIARPRIDRDMKARGGRIVGGKIVEISLVDRPALPTAKFAILKAAGTRGTLQFVGKVVTLGDADPASTQPQTRAPRQVKQLQKGMHITAHVNGSGGLEAIEGRVVTQTRYGFTLDVRGYDRGGGDRSIDRSDVVALYKGSVPLTAIEKGTPPPPAKSGNSTEASVAADPKDQPDVDPASEGEDDDADDVVEKAVGVACANCGATDFDGDKCGKCGTMKAAAADATKDIGDATVSATLSAPKVAKVPKVSKRNARVEPADGGFAVLKGSKVVGGPFPTEDEATASATAINDARKAAKVEKVAARKAKADEKVAKKVATAQANTPWALKRLHDAFCPAYTAEAIEAAYPSAEGGAVIGKTSRAALYAAMSEEITNGDPNNAAGLARTIAALNDLRRAEKRGGAPVQKAIDAQHADENLVFKLANGLTEANADGLPKPGDDAIQPGKFTRGYIRSGHQDPGGSGHGKANIPSATHPLHASDFGRGALTEGHQRYISQKMADVHDGLTEWKPDLCRMDANGSMAFDRQPTLADVNRENVSAINAFKAVDNQDTAGPTPRDLGKTKRAPGEKSAKGTVNAAQIRDIIAAANAPLLNKISALEGTVNDMASAPDPHRSATRGMTAVLPRKIDKVDGGSKGQNQSGRSARKAEKVSYMRSLASSGDPENRIRAVDWLASRGLDLE